MSDRTGHRGAVALVGVALLCTVGACSGSDGGGGDTASADSTRPTATASPVNAPLRSRLSQSRPIVGETVTIEGTVRPAQRPVELQELKDGAWSRVASTRTGDGGRYSLEATAGSGRTRYRVLAPAVVVERTQYAARTSDPLPARAVRATAELSVVPAPVGGGTGDGQSLTPGEARFTPPRPGAPVVIQQKVGARWRTAVTDGVQEKNGRFRFQVDPASVAKHPTFRAVTRPADSVPASRSRSVSAARWTQVWSDEFDGRGLDPDKWQTRVQPPGGRRLCSTPDASRVAVRRGVAELSIKQVGKKSADCPQGVFQNAMIGTGGVTSPGYTATRGLFAARVKFQKAQGMHGSFWMQGPAVTGAEIDVAEYFGDGRADGGLTAFVHHTNAAGELSSSGGVQKVGSLLEGEQTPADGWHVYSVEWTREGYVFRLDGARVLTTAKPSVATAPEIMILSLLTSDYELPRLRDPGSTMKVDWVRVWQE